MKMGVLEDIAKMRKRGVSDSDIVKNLQDQGISPKAINDALNQADIKKAVSEEGGEESGNENFISPQGYSEGYGKTQDVSDTGQDDSYYPPSQEQGYSEYEPQQQQGYDYSGQPMGLDTSTIIEISEQVFAEKIQKIQKKVDEISDFKSMSESKIESISERLKKLESVMDRLQISILDRVGGYGSSLDGIKKEMSMMQDSFGKIASSVAGNQARGGAGKKVSDSEEQGKNREEAFSGLKKISRKK